MKNNLLGLTLGDVLLLLGVRERTGEMVIESGNNLGTILMHRGRILQASSPYSRSIGDLLVEDGLITDMELMETLKIQKQHAYLPLGGLLLKMGRVTFEVVEMMVHEQIRQSMKEFQSWKSVNFSFTDKDISPFDRIHLTVHEFIPTDTVQTVKVFFSHETSSPPAESSAIL